MKAVHYLFLALLVIAGSLAEAGIYRWVDQQGKVHFGDRPHSDTAEKLDLPEASGEDSGSDQQLDAERRAARQRLLDSYEEERESKRAESEKQQAEEEKRVKNCVYAKDILRGYESSPTIYQPLEGGGRRYYSPAERRGEIERVRAEVERWCSE